MRPFVPDNLVPESGSCSWVAFSQKNQSPGIKRQRCTRRRFPEEHRIAGRLAGAGLAWLPFWLVAERLRAGVLELAMDSGQVTGTENPAVWPRADHLPLKTQAAIGALAARIPALISEGR
jgi:DNA-binding transcriptional LysR family regulator